MERPELLVNTETQTNTREAASEQVANRLQELLSSLNEALDQYGMVECVDGTAVEATTEHEQMLAKAQRMLEGVQGMLEQARENEDHHSEEAVAVVVDALQHLVGFLGGRADLSNNSGKDVVPVLDRIASALLERPVASDEETAGNDTVAVSQAA